MSISLYIHWPFCKSKCPYCDFNSHVRAEIDHDRWSEAYLQEINFYREKLSNNSIKSIFFGGGTPSLAKASMISKILNHLNSISNFDENIEITLEANPTSFETNKFKDFKSAGISRISLGIQSLNENDLKFLGREHSKDEALHAITQTRNIFNNYSFDLIYTLPNQTPEIWQKELNFATQFIEKHMSLYQLTIEKGTKFYSAYQKGEFTLPYEETSASLYSLTLDHMRSLGYERYEVSNFAKPSYESKHNLNYWTYGEFIGIGAGAHGRLKNNNIWESTQNIYNPENWLSMVAEKGNGIQKSEKLSDHDARLEKIIMGMRIQQGIEENIANSDAVKMLIDQGLITSKNGRIFATDIGFTVLDYVIREIS